MVEPIQPNICGFNSIMGSETLRRKAVENVPGFAYAIISTRPMLITDLYFTQQLF